MSRGRGGERRGYVTVRETKGGAARGGAPMVVATLQTGFWDIYQYSVAHVTIPLVGSGKKAGDAIYVFNPLGYLVEAGGTLLCMRADEGVYVGLASEPWIAVGAACWSF